MIKIIKRGTRKTCTCDNCGCVFSYEEEDVIIEQPCLLDTMRMGQDYYTEYIHCPQCDEEVVLKQTK